MGQKIDELFKKRLLRKVSLDKEKVNSSIKIAEAKLGEAKKLFEADFFSNAVLSAYTCMFHSARALLYLDGIQEKSHYATYVYLREKFSNEISNSLMNSYNHHKDLRHEILYGFESEIKKDESENAILDAEDFLEEVKKLIEI